MNEYETFLALLEEEKKEEALAFVMDLLKNKKMDVLDLYIDILAPSLNNMECNLADRNICIWKEHVRTGIIRTIVECCFPYVMEKKYELNHSNAGIAVVLCPPEEYHDLGARMVTDFFTICGYHSIFVGSNTPYHDFYNAINVICPNIVAISVSNYYNLASTKKIISDLKKVDSCYFKIIVGGHAFTKNIDNYKMVGADYYANSYLDIEKITRNEVLK